MSNPLVCQIIGGILALSFIFLLVMCWKTWRVTHILFTFFAFAAAATFLAFSSFVLKTHAAWRAHYEAYTSEIRKTEEQREKLMYGDLGAGQAGEDGIRGAKAKLRIAVEDRGRVWRECTLAQKVDVNTFRLSTVPAGQAPNVAPAPNEIQPGNVVFAFAERDTEDGWKVPDHYLGEYVVDAATENEVTMSALLPLDPDQVQKIDQGQTNTWTLYENMLIDSHEVFAELDPKDKIMVGVSKEELAKFMPNLFNWPQDKYDKFLDQFYRFNRDATEQDVPENTWVMLKFLKPHSIQVDSDTEQSLLEGGGRFFDSSGRALEGRLRRGEDGTVRFEVGDTGVFDIATADKLITDGICQKVKSVYRRSLHDYERFFRQAFFRHRELDESLARAKRDADTMIAMKVKAEEQVATYQAEKLKLEQDLVGFRTEQNETTAYLQALTTQWEKTRARLSELYRTNDALTQELTQIQTRLAQEINRRALEATAEASPPATPPGATSP
jgi:hypothetical protein